MAEVREQLTPMLSQYFELCAEYDDALVLFQVGDFYETFCEAAEETARVCEVTLTKREDSTGRYPMAGVPIDNAAKYLERLLDAGYRVAVADQVEDAEEASGLVDRAVTRIITPGTVVDDELLTTGANYVAGVASDGGRWGLAAVDVSTGECLVTGTDDRERLREELNRLAPSELVAGPDATVEVDALDAEPMVSDVDAEAFERRTATDRLSAYVAAPETVVTDPVERRAVGGVLAYAEYTQGDDGPLEYVSRVRRYDPRESLRLDSTALRSLELFENRRGGSGRTLFDVVDETASALGRRRLSSWLRRPLVDADEIERRHDAVAELAGDAVVRETLSDHLADVYDLERLIGSVSRGRANARDLRSLCSTLAETPPIRDALADAEAPLLRELRERMDPLDDVRSLVDRAIVDDPPIEVTEGGVVAEGFDDELDDLRATEREGREWVADLEARERERTGIDSLEVGHNEVHGYYIEVTNPNLDRVPDDYTRRQTLKNSERFYTPELKRREDEILGAAERADKLEYERFREVRDGVAEEADRVQELADALADLDALASLSTTAVEYDYVRPELDADGVHVANGRHPVVERTDGEFVPNDADLPRGTVAVVTGPNMSGKSTYMRQVALCTVLAQAGGFVPADEAMLPIVDRVFTRVGASDDIAGGQSTFMREMSELTRILHDATEDSLVLLDEVGRGTSTADGLAIAWATTEFLHDEVGATTLFATHYHDLTALADDRDGVRNLHFTADRDPDDGSVTFLHRVAEGPSSSSYGVEVARMAGVPGPVVERSADLVEEPPTPVRDGEASRDDTRTTADGADPPTQSLDDDERAVLDELRRLDVATTTPMEALNALYDLQRRLQ
jgi:DNA mismatch repair protein MutS